MYVCKCIWKCSCFLENPYLRQLSKISEEYSTGARPILTYIIAVDDNGTMEEQKSLTSVASFQFVNSDGSTFDNISILSEFMEASFQYYILVLSALDEDAEGSYTLILGWYSTSFIAIIDYIPAKYK